MAKLSIIPFTEQPLKNGDIPLYIRLSHNGKRSLLSTEYSVPLKKINKGAITDIATMAEVTNNILMPMQGRLNKISNLSELSAKQVMDIISQLNIIDKITSIDFIYFSQKHIEILQKAGKTNSSANFVTLINAIKDYTNRETLYTNEITLQFLLDFSKHLQIERSITRLNQGKLRTYKKAPVSDQTLNNYIRDFRTLFNACRDSYNDTDLGIITIPNYPFKKYKFKTLNKTKGFRTIEIQTLKKLINTEITQLDGRLLLARDMYLLSFYLIGINPTDLYDLTKDNLVKDRIEYRRNKTKERRADGAFISIKVPGQAKEIIERYKGIKNLLWLSVKYSNVDNAIRAVNTGLKKLAEKYQVDHDFFTWYSARHTWASIARNNCGYSLEDVGIALNHSADNKVTDGYVKRDWSLIDKMNTKVLKKVMEGL